MKILGREPAVFFALLAGLALAIIQLVNVTDPVAGALNAVVLGAAGLATAAVVGTDKVLPALVGLVQAVFAVFLAYGSPVAEHTQAGILALIAAAAAFFVRQQVDAPLDWEFNRSGFHAVTQTVRSPGEHYSDKAGQHADGPDFQGEVR